MTSESTPRNEKDPVAESGSLVVARASERPAGREEPARGRRERSERLLGNLRFPVEGEATCQRSRRVAETEAGEA
ncbi:MULTISPECIES: hypothetical protein [Haloferacaceae]|uniref:Uncharacterized protein n=1 Tax=Halorubrum glutamatedens TaxID=2707018 RepID=A0ABD5QQ75_9EURY|nr:hypothetical protein [Halobellus captivus]